MTQLTVRTARICLLAASLAAAAGWAEQRVRVGIYQNSPKVGVSESGQPEGVFIDLIEAIAADEGWSIEYVTGTWAQGLDRLEAAEIDLMPDVALTQAREALYAFHREPVLSDWFQVYTRRGSGIRSVLDLNGKRVSLLERSIQEDAFGKAVFGYDLNVTLVALPDYEAAFTAVSRGNADAVIANRFYGASHLRAHQLEDTAIIFNPTRLFFAAPKAGNPVLLEAIDKHLVHMKQDPASVYYRSLRRWTSEEVKSPFPMWIKGAGIGAAALLLLSLFWSVTLKHKVAARTRELALRHDQLRAMFDKIQETEQTLRESETRFRALFEQMSSGVAVYEARDDGADFIVKDISPTGQKISRVAKADVLGKSVKNAFPGAVDMGLVAVFQRVWRTGAPEQHPVSLYKDGRLTQWFENKVYKLPSGEIVAVYDDVTARQQAESERERLMAAIEQSGEIVIITDAEGTIQYVNPSFLAVTGYSRKEALGQNPRLLKSGNQDEAFYRGLWQTLSSGNTWKGRFVNKRKNGTLYTEEATISPVRDAAGRIVNYVAVKRDITEHLQQAVHLQQAQKMESIGRLAGGVAHDFNNLLMGIMGYTELCRDALEPGSPLRAHLDEIMNDAKRSAAITRQLLAFARKQMIAPVVLNLNDAVSGMLKLLRRLIGEDINLVWSPGAGDVTVKMDPSQIDQILANLAVNARDAIGGVGKLVIETDTVSLDAAFCSRQADAVPGDYVVLGVSDTGCGMDKSTLEHIFEPFFTTKRAGSGTGLGLATVYGIAKQNKGFITVASELGKGTAFRIYLPRYAGDGADGANGAEPAECPGGTETVLLVEDEKSVRVTARAFLMTLGYTVLSAESPEEAMRLSAEHPGAIPLLLTDVVMPGLSGRDLAQRLAEKRPAMRCLFMSGYTADIIAHRGILDKDLDFLPKPFNRDQLARKVREVLDRTLPS